MSRAVFVLFLLLDCITSASGQITSLYSFIGSPDGTHPMNTLVSDGTFLYGMTYAGGTNDLGTIYKVKTDGSGDSILLNLNGTGNGRFPFGGLIYDGVFLYGMTTGGGQYGGGTIFKIKTDGTSYQKLFDFNGIATGCIPYGSLCTDGGYLYGTTRSGGIDTMGTVFRIATDGSGYQKLFDFDGLNGNDPTCSLLYDGYFLYGTTGKGGTCDSGTIFRIHTDGSGYLKLLDFNSTTGAYYPYSDLLLHGPYLIGTSNYGGANSFGCIYRIMTNGASYSDIYDFNGASSGNWPIGKLFSDGYYLYGTTYYGGQYYDGTLFRILQDGSGYLKLLDFDGTNTGTNPHGSLISDGTYLFGLTQSGGSADLGTVFNFLIADLSVHVVDLADPVQIFPVPSNGLIQASVGFAEPYDINVINSIGQVVYHETDISESHHEINLSDLPRGVYFCLFSSISSDARQKIIIE